MNLFLNKYNAYFVFFCFASSSMFAQNKQYTFLFETGKAIIAKSEASEFVSLIKGIKADSITIQGHCDSIGSETYNQALSEQRTSVVRNFLLQNGIRKKDIKIWEGLGETQPIASNDNDEDRTKNRRVEVYLNQIPEAIMAAHQKQLASKVKVKKPIEIKKAKFVAGEKIYLPNLTFQGNRHYLTAEGEVAFLELLENLKKYPTKKIMLIGHICCTYGGQVEAMDIDLNTLDLSVQRAKEIYYKLKENGIDKSRMQFKGMGSTEKIYPNENNLQEQQFNRRVEILITN